jgi:hypothetical protein
MALSSQEQNKVVQILGYGGKTLQAGSVIYNKILNDRLHQLPIDTENLVRAYLAQIAVLEQQIFQAPSRLAASKVNDIELNAKELSQLRTERKKFARELAAHLDIPYIGISGGSNIGVTV